MEPASNEKRQVDARQLGSAQLRVLLTLSRELFAWAGTTECQADVVSRLGGDEFEQMYAQKRSRLH